MWLGGFRASTMYHKHGFTFRLHLILEDAIPAARSVRNKVSGLISRSLLRGCFYLWVWGNRFAASVGRIFCCYYLGVCTSLTCLRIRWQLVRMPLWASRSCSIRALESGESRCKWSMNFISAKFFR